MEPKFQTSFIPKAPITGGPTVGGLPRENSFSFLPTLGSIIFAVALLASGGLFAYAQVLNSQISDLNKSLSLAQAAFDQDTIKQLSTASDQIQAAKTLLNNHIAVSNLFALLESNMLPSVQFSNFTFQNGQDSTIVVSVNGLAQSYESAAKQSALFNSVDYMTNTVFSSLNMTDKGTVSMIFTSNIDPKAVSYTQALQALSGTSAPIDTTASSTIPTSPGN